MTDLLTESSDKSLIQCDLCSLCFESYSDCNQTLSSSFGHLTSPGYPARYHNYHNCTTVLSSPSGTFLVLYFDDFQLESGGEDCIFDYLRVSPILLSFSCGMSERNFWYISHSYISKKKKNWKKWRKRGKN